MLVGKTVSYQSMFHGYFCECMMAICKNVLVGWKTTFNIDTGYWNI
jgi:hypothetical protein